MDEVQAEMTKRCPSCGEQVLAVAKKCKHCGEWMRSDPPAFTENPAVLAGLSWFGLPLLPGTLGFAFATYASGSIPGMHPESSSVGWGGLVGLAIVAILYALLMTLVFGAPLILLLKLLYRRAVGRTWATNITVAYGLVAGLLVAYETKREGLPLYLAALEVAALLAGALLAARQAARRGTR